MLWIVNDIVAIKQCYLFCRYSIASTIQFHQLLAHVFPLLFIYQFFLSYSHVVRFDLYIFSFFYQFGASSSASLALLDQIHNLTLFSIYKFYYFYWSIVDSFAFVYANRIYRAHIYIQFHFFSLHKYDIFRKISLKLFIILSISLLFFFWFALTSFVMYADMKETSYFLIKWLRVAVTTTWIMKKKCKNSNEETRSFETMKI